MAGPAISSSPIATRHRAAAAGPTLYLNYEQARDRMGEIVIAASRDSDVIAFALNAVQSVMTGFYANEAAVLFKICRDGIRYVGDTSAEDLYKWPMLTLKERAGDCNNKVVLFGSLARAIGFPVRLCFLFAEADPDFATDFPIHVFAEVDLYKGERMAQQWAAAELTPLPDPVSGFPCYTLPFGYLPQKMSGYVDRLDVDGMLQ
jgi:transglutaminase-like putative cysteine protease